MLVSLQDAAPFKAETSYRSSEPEPVYSTEAAGVPEASSQQSLAYTSEPVYETTEAPGHYQAGTGPTLAMPRGGRGPEKSFPPLCSLERVDCCLITWDYTLG